jgi:hypothetical protein
MSKREVGKWYVAQDEDGDAIAIAETARGPNGGWVGVDIARMPVPGKYKTRADINNHARLIAAAPETAAERDRLKEVNAELLAALKDAVDLTDNLYSHMTPEELSLVDVWRAAIAKAEGKS